MTTRDPLDALAFLQDVIDHMLAHELPAPMRLDLNAYQIAVYPKDLDEWLVGAGNVREIPCAGFREQFYVERLGDLQLGATGASVSAIVPATRDSFHRTLDASIARDGAS